MLVLTKTIASQEGLNLGNIPSHISDNEELQIEKVIGVTPREFAGGLIHWFDVIKMKDGTFRTRNRFELLNKTKEEVEAA